MNKRISSILVLMTVCVSGVTGLQLYWNYQNYRNTVKSFSHDINEAFNIAVDKEMDQRRRAVLDKVREWVADTNFITLTCNNHNRHRETIFQLSDTHPIGKNDKMVRFGIKSFKKSLSRITPEAKQVFINYFCETIVREDIKKGVLYFYTQRLGDSLAHFYETCKLRPAPFRAIYKQELLLKDIDVGFQLDTGQHPGKGLFLTRPVNAALNRPYEKEYVSAGLGSPDSYYFKEMKWLIITSLLLITITFICFGYTVKTLLSQQQLAELKDNFINNMTHELNTPLASIAITAEAMRSFDQDKQTQKAYLDIISYQAAKLSGLTAQILKAGNLAKKESISDDLTDAGLLVSQAIEDLRPQITKMSARILFNAPDAPAYIRGAADDLRNIFVNLLDNALKYNPGKAIVKISISRDKNYHLIIFEDNGIGISEEYREKVFDAFFRVPTGNTHDVKGYGLGLNMVSDVTRKYGGTVRLTANKPAGCIFTVLFPLV